MHRKIDFKIAIQMIAFLLGHFTSLNIHSLLELGFQAGRYVFTNIILQKKTSAARMKARFHWNKGVQVEVLCPDRKCPSVGPSPRQDSNCNFLSCPAAPATTSLPLPLSSPPLTSLSSSQVSALGKI